MIAKKDYVLVVAKSIQQAERQVRDMEIWNCLMEIFAYEVKDVDGYKIKVEQ